MSAPSAGAATPSAADALAVMLDPVNRFYRYPLAARLVPWLLPTRITADQVTAAQGSRASRRRSA